MLNRDPAHTWTRAETERLAPMIADAIHLVQQAACAACLKKPSKTQ